MRAIAMTAAALLLVGVVVVQLGSITGRWKLTPILSGSMGRGMPVGSVAVAVPINASDVRAGDVLVFKAPTPERPVMAHRVNRRIADPSGPVFETKGDANPGIDAWQFRVVGSTAWRVDYVLPSVGRMVIVANEPLTRFGVLLAAVAVCTWFCVRWIWRPDRQPARRHARLNSSADRPIAKDGPETKRRRAATGPA